MSTGERPAIRELERAEIDRILERNHVGRIAFCLHDRPQVQPIHYVYREGWIYGRTSAGVKVETIRHNWWVAFEVDEVEGPFAWRSVVVHGGFYMLSPDGPPTERERWRTAVAALREMVPETFRATDPVPFRTIVFSIPVQEYSGREAVPAAEAPW